MREIKFRSFYNNSSMLYSESYVSLYFFFELQPERFPLMQFTGFQDFDGEEIYEGDILEYVHFRRDENKRREFVVFSQICGGWYVHKQADTLADVLFKQHNEEWQLKQNYKPSLKHKVRIIGNIYENPELLKQ